MPKDKKPPIFGNDNKEALEFEKELQERRTVDINFNQAKQLLELFGGEEAIITLVETDEGLLAYYADYPNEGSFILDE